MAQYFKSGFPLNGRDFSFLSLPAYADLSNLDLSNCRFIRGCFERVKFDKAYLQFAVIDRAFAAGASFSGAQMFGVHIECSGLMPDNRDGAQPFSQPVDLRGADLRLSSLRHNSACCALLQGSTLPSVIVGTDFRDSLFDATTQIEMGLGSNQQMMEAKLRELGARHEDDAKAAT